MEPMNFNGVNVVYGASQTEYQPLPAERRGKPQIGEILTCWQLSPDEIKKVQETGYIWLDILTFNNPLLPVLLTVEKPPIYAPDEQV